MAFTRLVPGGGRPAPSLAAMHKRSLCIFMKRTYQLRAPKCPRSSTWTSWGWSSPTATQVVMLCSFGLARAEGQCWDSGGRLRRGAVARTHAILPLLCPCQIFSSPANGSTVWASRPATSRVRKQPNLQSLAGCRRHSFIFAIRMITRLSSSPSLMTHLTPTSSDRFLHGERRPNNLCVASNPARAWWLRSLRPVRPVAGSRPLINFKKPCHITFGSPGQ